MLRVVSRSFSALTLLSVVALAATGCTTGGSDGAGPEPAPRPSSTSTAPAPEDAAAPHPFRAATRRLPSGYTRARCSDLRGRDNSGLAVSLAVPPGYEAVSRDDTSCGFAAGFGREFYVAFGAGETLRREKESDVDPFVDTGGDDSVSDVRYAGDVAVFGRHRGESLAYYCYCDGQDLDQRIVQARGVRLSWTTRHARGEHRASFRAATASMSLRPSTTSTCRTRGRTLTFRPPLPQTESIDFGGGVCHLYLRPGRASLLRYAEIAGRPRGSLAELAERVRARGDVSGVVLERGAASLAGHAADRLTWTITRRQQTDDYQPAGTWRAVALQADGVRVIWSATPHQWRTERNDAEAFFRSVH
ncbi:MAG TPA: hypothetical protein VGE77_00630 [Nocardioides sp.]